MTLKNQINHLITLYKTQGLQDCAKYIETLPLAEVEAIARTCGINERGFDHASLLMAINHTTSRVWEFYRNSR